MPIQMVNSPSIDRRDHVWNRIENTDPVVEGVDHPPHKYKCVLCGGVDVNPPPFPTPQDWLPSTVVELTQEERDLCKRKQ